MSTKKLLIIVSSVVFLFISVFLTYVSLLGENNKIDIEIDKYFQTLKNQDYIEAFKKIDGFHKDGKFLKDNFNYDFGFVNYLALRDKFNCINTEDYKFEYKKHSFWLPFQNMDMVKVGVRMIRINDYNTFTLLLDENKPDYLDEYITMKRINGIWRIIDINGHHPGLVENFKNVSKRVDSNSFIVNGEKNVSFKNYKIEYTKLEKMDIKIIKFQLNKVENMIDKPDFFTSIGDKG